MALPTASDNVFPKVVFAEGAAPATPSANQVKTYAKADGLMYSKDDAGTETLMSAGAGATRASLGLDTTDSPQFAGLNVGAATDTTITRTGAGDIAVEGNAIYRAGGTDVPIGDGGTGASTKAAGFDALQPMTTSGDVIYGGASGTGTRLAKGADGTVLTLASGLPSWAAVTGTGTVTTVKDEGSNLSTAVVSIDFVGAGVTATGTTAVTVTIPGGGSSDYVSGASGTGQIIIPGLFGSPDIRVAATNDDEFDTTDVSDPMTGWTTLGTPTAHNINSTVKSHYYIRQAATASTDLVGIYKAIPSAPFTVTCKISDSISRGDYNKAFLFVAEASPGKIETFSTLHTTGPDPLQLDLWTSRTSYSSTPGTVGAPAGRLPIYLRCVVTTTTSLAWYYSEGGLHWRRFNTGHNPGFTVGTVGLGVASMNATYDGEASFDWIRFV